MQLFISIVTPLDFSRQVEYSCVISLSAAATNCVLKKNAKPIAVTFLVHSRLFATSLLNFSIIVNSHLRGALRSRSSIQCRFAASSAEPMSTLDAELNDFRAQLAMLGGHAADRDGQAEAARPGTARIEKECAVLCLDLGLVRMTVDYRIDVVRGLGVKLGQST